jgi:uncharacterized membrane protein
MAQKIKLADAHGWQSTNKNRRHSPVLEEAQICTGSFCFVLFLFLRDFPL